MENNPLQAPDYLRFSTSLRDSVNNLNIPYDIIVNNIIPYTYCIQPAVLLEDIKNYYQTKSTIMRDRYHSSIKLELMAYFYIKNMFDTILQRRFSMNVKQYTYADIHHFSFEKRFCILFGLLTKEERDSGMAYVNMK